MQYVKYAAHKGKCPCTHRTHLLVVLGSWSLVEGCTLIANNDKVLIWLATHEIVLRKRMSIRSLHVFIFVLRVKLTQRLWT